MGFPESGADAVWHVADASVWINLAATARCADILATLATPVAIAEIAMHELERGAATGHNAWNHIDPLIRSGRIEVMKLTDDDERAYLNLVAGGTAETLDDGEAATLVLAARLSGIALIDERKAMAIARKRFPALELRSTTDLLFATLPDEGGTEGPLPEALFAALQGARMRIPHHWQPRVVEVLGPDRTRLCHSLPAHLRLPSGTPAEAALF